MKSVILPFIKYGPSTYESISFWDDPWLDYGLIISNKLDYLEKQQAGINQNATVKDLILNNKFCMPSTTMSNVQALWTRIEASDCRRSDSKQVSWNWKGESFNIKNMYIAISGTSPSVKCRWYKQIWKTDNSQKENLLLWKVINRALLTKDKLINLGMNIEARCVLCGDCPEDYHHIFFQCDKSQSLWHGVLQQIGYINFPMDSPDQWSYIKRKSGVRRPKSRLFNFILKKVVKSIWTERNQRVFDSSHALTAMQWRHQLWQDIREGLKMLSFTFDPGIFVP